ncbi:MAG: hypothetical protein ABIH55_04220, partial [Nanoarchaeota archaeon]
MHKIARKRSKKKVPLGLENEQKIFVFLLAMIFMLFVGFVSYSGTAENIGMGWGALIETDEATTQTSGLDDF